MKKLLKYTLIYSLAVMLVGITSCSSGKKGGGRKVKGHGGTDCPAFRGGKPSGKSGPRKVGWF